MSSDELFDASPSNLRSILAVLRVRDGAKRPRPSRGKPPALGLTWDMILDGRTHIFRIKYEGCPWKGHEQLRAACYREAARRALTVETHLYGDEHFEVKASRAWPNGTMLGDLAPVLYEDDGKPVWHVLPEEEPDFWHPDRGPRPRRTPSSAPTPPAPQ